MTATATAQTKRPIRIVTDSAARVPSDWAQAHDVIVLPHLLNLDGKTYREDIDLAEPEFSKQVRALKKPFTVSPPSVEDFSAVYRQLADEKAEVISLHISAALNDTVKNAQRAREDYRGRCNIQIIDSRTIALGLNALVTAAVTLTEPANQPIDSVVKQLRGLMQHIYGIFISDDMPYLERSKRLRPAQSILGKILEIIPCLSLEDGDLVAVEKVRSPERAIEKLTEFASEFDDSAAFAVLQLLSQPHDRTLELIESLKLAFPRIKSVPIRSCGAQAGSIIGPGGVGVMIYEGKI
jgi:DegV family protein with EDD domain